MAFVLKHAHANMLTGNANMMPPQHQQNMMGGNMLSAPARNTLTPSPTHNKVRL